MFFTLTLCSGIAVGRYSHPCEWWVKQIDRMIDGMTAKWNGAWQENRAHNRVKWSREVVFFAPQTQPVVLPGWLVVWVACVHQFGGFGGAIV